MATWIEPPPSQRGMGCFAKGCLLLLAFACLLVVAFIGGIYYARNKILPTTGIDLPRINVSAEQAQSAEQRWKAFTDAADLRKPARVEFTPDEINALIGADDPQWRGRIHVSIEQNIGRLRVSVPMDETGWLKGHYLNTEGTVQPAQNKNAADAQITNIKVNGQPVPDRILQWLGWWLHDQVEKWCAEYELKTFDISDGKVILETRGE